uniref:CASP-like protein 2A3 n=1 Tax=Picea sitchensis TaxID=3332 RepID=CSPL3_PICSI|nr:RecName: Full=CASP-like protein 2A3; Short=PsCASPL2A3 [Picea sitchensis]ADE76091.1 unknown [Picea sitchensis]
MELIYGSTMRKKWIEPALRFLPVGLCISALALMLKSKEGNENGILEYKHVGAFRYLAYANGICAAYSVLSTFNSVVPRSCSLSRAWFVFVFDQAFTYLMLGAGAVVTEVLYLAYKGDEKITWFEICPYYGRFCNRVAASLVISFLALLCFIPLSLISAYRVFSKYDPPSLCKKDQITSQS